MITQAIDLDHPILGFTHSWVNAIAHQVDQLHIMTLLAGRRNLAPNVSLHAYYPKNQPDIPWQRYLFFQRKFHELIWRKEVDAVFVHMIPKWAVITAPYAKLRRIPVGLWYAHGHVPRILVAAEKIVDGIVTSTPEGCRINTRKLHVVGQGIDTAHFQPGNKKDNGRFRILTVGRLSLVKKLEETIETVRILVQHHGCDNAELQLIGGTARPEDEQYVAKLKRLIEKYDLQQHVSFAGTRTYDSIVHAYQQGDVLLNLSRTNSLDKVALEAMACGIPVITSNPAFKSLMEAVDAQLFLPTKTIEAAAAQLHSLANSSPAERKKLGMALREQVNSDHNLTQLARRITTVMSQFK